MAEGLGGRQLNPNFTGERVWLTGFRQSWPPSSCPGCRRSIRWQCPCEKVRKLDDSSSSSMKCTRHGVRMRGALWQSSDSMPHGAASTATADSAGCCLCPQQGHRVQALLLRAGLALPTPPRAPQRSTPHHTTSQHTTSQRHSHEHEATNNVAEGHRDQVLCDELAEGQLSAQGNTQGDQEPAQAGQDRRGRGRTGQDSRRHTQE